MKLREKELIEWAWLNLQFYNSPENWQETYITDILADCKGSCYKNDGKVITYEEIRTMFEQKEYVVIASNVSFKYMYITKDLNMVDSLSDKCIWDYDYDVIDAIVSKDGQKYNYTYEIVEF
jgi:hypothetical protein